MAYQALEALRVHGVPLEILERQAKWARLGPMGNLAPKVRTVSRDLTVAQETLGHQANKEAQVSMALPEHQETQGLQVHRAPWALQDQAAPMVPLAVRALLASRAQWGQQETRARPDRMVNRVQ